MGSILTLVPLINICQDILSMPDLSEILSKICFYQLVIKNLESDIFFNIIHVDAEMPSGLTASISE